MLLWDHVKGSSTQDKVALNTMAKLIEEKTYWANMYLKQEKEVFLDVMKITQDLKKTRECQENSSVNLLKHLP